GLFGGFQRIGRVDGRFIRDRLFLSGRLRGRVRFGDGLFGGNDGVFQFLLVLVLVEFHFGRRQLFSRGLVSGSRVGDLLVRERFRIRRFLGDIGIGVEFGLGGLPSGKEL